MVVIEISYLWKWQSREIERNQLELDDALKEVGEYNPTIDLGHGVTVKFKITILDEAAPAAE